MPNDNHTGKRFAWTIGPAFAIIISALALFGFDQYLDYKIERALQDPQNLQKIASRVRPGLIFDSKGSIIADMGGESVISDIQFEYDKEFLHCPSKIVITPNRYLRQAPILTPLDDMEYIIRVQQGPLRSWQYDLSPLKIVDRAGALPRFRLEILGE